MTTTRFAPSPTGYLHVGNLRTALFNHLIALQRGGTFVLRLDDTDPERSRPEFAEAIQEDLSWLGISWDRIERQSERLDRYARAAGRLRESGLLYECFETPAELDLKRKKLRNMNRPPVYDRAALSLSEAQKSELRETRKGHWRFKLTGERESWSDLIAGDISIDTSSVSDPVLIREDGQVLYTLASVVDDSEMGMTHVVRGADHLTNTATQIQIFKALGSGVPAFAHHSLLTDASGGALAKRAGTLSLRDLRERGIEPMALLSYLARIGSADSVRLRKSIQELVDNFDISRFSGASTPFDVRDLEILTARHIYETPYSLVRGELSGLGVGDDLAEAFWDAIRENIGTKRDIPEWWDLCENGAEPRILDEDREFVSTALRLLPPKPYDSGTWGEWTGKVKEATGRSGRSLFKPLRMALTGREHGPEMEKILPLLQRIRAIE